MKFTDLQKQNIKQQLQSAALEQKSTLIVEAPYELTKSELSSITAKFSEFKDLTPKLSVDPSLLAGFRLICGSQIIDCTLKTRLNNLFK